MTVSNWQALVIQKVDNAIHCINHYPADNAVGIHNTYPHWIVIYPVDYAIEHLINRGQNCNVDVADKRTTALSLFNSKLGLHTWKISAVINATVREKSKKTENKNKNKPGRQHKRKSIGPIMSLLLSSQPVLCMISETKEAVDHTTWETFPILFQQ